MGRVRVSKRRVNGENKMGMYLRLNIGSLSWLC